MQSTSTQQLHVLLAEDSDEDAFFFRRALEASRLNALLIHVPDGHQAIA